MSGDSQTFLDSYALLWANVEHSHYLDIHSLGAPSKKNHHVNMLAPFDPSIHPTGKQTPCLHPPPILSTVHFDDVQLIPFLWTSSNYLNHLESLGCSQKAGNVSLKSAESCLCLTLPGCQLRVHYCKLLTLGMVNHEDELQKAHPREGAKAMNQWSAPGVTVEKENPRVLQTSVFCISSRRALRKYREGFIETKIPTFNASSADARLWDMHGSVLT